jgi:hypothetical protein
VFVVYAVVVWLGFKIEGGWLVVYVVGERA